MNFDNEGAPRPTPERNEPRHSAPTPPGETGHTGEGVQVEVEEVG